MSSLLHRIDRWLEVHAGGHATLGPVTIFGNNAMHYTIEVTTRRWGYLCIRPPVYSLGRWHPWHVFASPNGTPWAATFMAGPRFTQDERRDARYRRRKYGHNFDSRILNPDIHPEVVDLYPEHFQPLRKRTRWA